MNFVRKGPGYLFLRTKTPQRVEKKLVFSLGGESAGFCQALEGACEDSTVVFISHIGPKKTRVGDAVSIVLLQDTPPILLTRVINEKLTDIIHHVDIGPGQIVMRIPEEGEEVIQEVKENYGAETVSIRDGISRGEVEDTIISFTERPLRSNIGSLDLVEESLLVESSFNSVFQHLRQDCVRFITHGLDHSQWYEVKINIYDSDDEYEKQYERLVTVLSDLEVGFILGESWTKDHAIALLSVIAYQVRMFSIMPPREVKKILLSLEYNDQGKRIVDFDLYHRSEKVSWSSFRTGSYGRSDLALELKKEVWGRLSEGTKEKLRELEEGM